MDFLLKALNNKEEIITQILNDFSQCQKSYEGLNNLIDKVENSDDKNLRHFLKTSMKTLRKQSNILSRVVLLLLIYTQSDGFSTDIAMMLAKMGKGNEALKAMWQSKMKG